MNHGRYDHLDLSEMPTVASLEALIGEEKLAQLSLDFGGSVVSIPVSVGENSPLAFSIGMEAAQKLADVWGGMHFTVPLSAGRNARVLRMRKDGMSVNKISRVLGVSRPVIYRIIAAEEDRNQLQLF